MGESTTFVMALAALLGAVPGILTGVAALRWSAAQQKELDGLTKKEEAARAALAAANVDHEDCKRRLAALEKKAAAPDVDGRPPSA